MPADGGHGTMRILVLGDSYCPCTALEPAFSDVATRHAVTFADVVDETAWSPTTDSERAIREYAGTPAQVISALDGHEILVVQAAPVTAEVMDADPALRLICCARGGPVNIDVAAASERGIPVVTTPGKNADAVAELTLAFMVMLARRLPEAIRHVEAGGVFGHDNYEGAGWFGHDLAGMTLGLVGFGQIGHRVTGRARAFAMRVLAFDPYVAENAVEAGGATPVDLPTLLGTSDVISLHARLTAENRAMMGTAEFGAMKRGGYFVNTARHELVDESALVEALASGQIAGAALDVATPSPETGRHALLAFPNVVIVPHIGGATWETLRHGGEMAAAEIERFAAGLPLVNVANRAAIDSASPQVRS